MDGTVQMCLKDTDSTTGFSLNILWSPKAVKKDDEQQQGNNTCETDCVEKCYKAYISQPWY